MYLEVIASTYYMPNSTPIPIYSSSSAFSVIVFVPASMYDIHHIYKLYESIC